MNVDCSVYVIWPVFITSPNETHLVLTIKLQQTFGSQIMITNLFILSGNELSQVEGLEGLQQLMELVLDRNKIKVCSLVCSCKCSSS